MQSIMDRPDRLRHRRHLLRCGLALLWLLASTIPPVPASATWFAGHSLTVPRTGHTATALADGSVLVTGGIGPDGFGPVGETERYDPTTGRWRLTDVLAIRRSGHAAALLPDGTVLVIGGFNSLIDPSATSERYNPATDTWSMSGRLQTSRAGGHTATVLADGSVLVAGGSNRATPGGPQFGPPVSSIERYTPATGSWSGAGSLVTARSGHTATLLADGRVLITGGWGASSAPYTSGPPLASAEIYNPATGRSSPAGAMLASRGGHTATRLPSGAVLVVGGAELGRPSAELFDPTTGVWRDVGRTTINRIGHTATLLSDGRVLVAGGGMVTSNTISGVPRDANVVMTELYDPATGRWTSDGQLAGGRLNHTATLLLDGQVLITGGTGPYSPSATTELYRPDPNPWRLTSSPLLQLGPTAAAVLDDGRVLLVGCCPTIGRTELYDPISETWTAAGSPITTVYYPYTATKLQDGSVLIVGVTGNGGIAAERYRPATGSWQSAGQLAYYHLEHTATLLLDGSVLVVSGQPDAYATPTPTGPVRAERYDPITNTWRVAGQPAISLGHTATLLSDGRVLVAGGQRAGDSSARAELYDPATDSWSATGAMLQARTGHGAARLPNGTVLVFGGRDRDMSLASAELYNPASGIWEPAESLLARRAWGRTATLADGTIMVSGDPYASSSGQTLTAEIYDPVAGRWQGVAVGMIVDPVVLIALRDGSLLAIGAGPFGQRLAERYGVTPSTPGPGPATTWYLAEGFTAAGTDEYLTLFNPGSAGQARLVYLPESPLVSYPYGPGPAVRHVPLAAGGRTTIRVHDERSGADPGGLGRLTNGHGTVIESSGPVVVERASYFTFGSGIDGGHAALGATALDRTWLFAEGYTGPGFDEYLTIVNSGPAGHAVIFYYVEGEPPPVPRIVSLPAASRVTVAVHNEGYGYPNPGGLGRRATGHAIKVEATVDIAVERAMYFAYANGIDGGHVTGGVAAPVTTWRFAEGYTGTGFDEYLTIFNPGPAGSATVTYHVEGQATPTTRTVPLAATSRTTITVHQPESPGNPGGLGRLSAGHATTVTTTVPVVVERPMYFQYSPTIDGGHLTIGATASATRWAFAEGFTGNGFDEYLTIFNPGPAGTATISYRLEGQASPITQRVPLAAGSRTTVSVHQPESAANPGGLGRQSVGHATLVESDVPIVVERPIYFAYSGGVTGGHVVLGARLP